MSKASKSVIGKFCDYDYVEDDSDQERGLDSSEDEIDVILHGTPKQKRKLSRSLSQGSLDLSSSEDEFEKEMELELEVSLKQHEQQFIKAAKDVIVSRTSTEKAGPSSQSTNTAGEVKSRQYYDDIYFDSDEEDENGSSMQGDDKNKQEKLGISKSKRHHVLSNDELFYDPNIDDNNQKWVDKQRSHYHTLNPNIAANSSELEGKMDKSPQPGSTPIKSDAILNCPACMTTLCLDCQRHEVYPTQYRAMFVLNCCIIRSERLKYKIGQNKKRKWKKPKGKSNGSGTTAQMTDTTAHTTNTTEEAEEYYHPVKCSECKTEVAVLDDDEVYHFFNVLAGIA